MFQIPQAQMPIVGLAPQVSGAAALTGDYISLKKVHKLWVVFLIAQGHATTVKCSLSKATAVAGTGATAVTADVPIWSNADVTATNALTRQTDDADFTTSSAVKNKIVIMQVDPSVLGDYDCIAGVTGISNALNLVSVLYIVEPRYSGEDQVFITD